MTFSQSAAFSIVPLIARIVLALAFIPAGWNKIMKDAEFAGDDAKRLRELQVVASASDSSRAFVVPVALLQAIPNPDAPIGPAPDSPAVPPPTQAPPRGGDAESGSGTGTSAGTTTGSPATGLATGEPVKARALHRVTLMVERAGMPYPTWMAWVAAITELVGGVCLVVGLFTRVWGLGLAIAMGTAFWLTSWPVLQSKSLFTLTIPESNAFDAQIALLALAFGLLLTGGGALSLDRRMGRGDHDGKFRKPAPVND